jgi:hypothetical protein
LTFNLATPTQTGTTLSTILPLNYLGNGLDSVSVDGFANPFTFQVINGQNVAFITTSAGNHTIVADYAGGTATLTPTPTLPPNAPDAAPSPYWNRKLAVTLSWAAVSWAEYYEIQVSENSLFTPPPPFPVDGVLPASTLSVVITVPHEGTYYWRIRAKDPQLGWQKGWSVPQRFTVDTP